MAETHDVLIIGAGVFGLCAALGFARAGRDVLLIDKAAAPGAGASGGLVGALSPFMPENWNIRKQAQLRALIAAPAYWQGVAALGGVDPLFARTGRYIPLLSAREAELAPLRGASAAAIWGDAGRWALADTLPDWLNPDAAPFGAVFESLSARIDPRRACATLTAAVRAAGGVFQGGVTVSGFRAGQAQTDQGAFNARLIVLATGAAAWPGAPKMRAVKGQAALLDGGLPADSPSLYADGLYIIAHGDGRVAVGSTSEDSFAAPDTTDNLLDQLLERAGVICPPLQGRKVLDRWAGLRPRAPKPEPMLGWVADGVLLATGGFRTGLAMAPLVADALVSLAQGGTPDVPPHYHIAHHIRPR